MADGAGRGVRRQFAGLFSARLAAAALAFATTVIAARYLGPEAFGRFSILVVLSKVFFDLASPALDTAAVRFTARELERPGGDPGGYFCAVVRLKYGLIAALLVGGVAAAAPLQAYLLPGTDMPFWAVYAAFPLGAAMIFWSIAQAYFQARRQVGRMAAFEGGYAALRLGAIALCVAAASVTPVRPDETALFLAQGAAAVVVGAAAFGLVPKDYRSGPISRAAVRDILAYAKWILAACACTALAQGADVLVLAGTGRPSDEVGAYRAAVTLMLAGELAIMTLFQVLLPKASGLTTKAEYAAFLRRYQARAAILGLCMVPAVALAPALAPPVFGSEYGQTGAVFAVLLVGTAFMLSTAPAGAAVYAIGKARVIASLEAAKLLLIVATAIPAAMHFGAYGVAAAVAGSRALIAAATYWAARRAVAAMADTAA